MLQPWRPKVRETEQALRDGRLEDASELVDRDDFRQYLPGRRLMMRLAKRAQQRVRNGDSSAGRQDLENARKLAGDTKQPLHARQKMVDQRLDKVRHYLSADDLQSALRHLSELQHHNVGGPRMRTMKEIILRFETAQRLAHHGKFAEARETLAQAAQLDDNLLLVKDQMQVYENRVAQTQGWTAKMHRCMAAGKWSKVLTWPKNCWPLPQAIAKRSRRGNVLGPNWTLGWQRSSNTTIGRSGRPRCMHRPIRDHEVWRTIP